MVDPRYTFKKIKIVIYKKVTIGNNNVSTVVTVIVAGVAKVMEPKLMPPVLVVRGCVISSEGDLDLLNKWNTHWQNINIFMMHVCTTY